MLGWKRGSDLDLPTVHGLLLPVPLLFLVGEEGGPQVLGERSLPGARDGLRGFPLVRRLPLGCGWIRASPVAGGGCHGWNM